MWWLDSEVNAMIGDTMETHSYSYKLIRTAGNGRYEIWRHAVMITIHQADGSSETYPLDYFESSEDAMAYINQ